MNDGPPPDKIVFYTDTCLGRKCAEALRNQGIHVEWHHDHFAGDAPDVEWLPVVSERGWIVLSKDKAMKQGTVEFAAVVASNARLFVLGRGNYTGQGMINIWVAHLASMVEFARNHPAPFIVSVSNSGLRIVHPRDDAIPTAASFTPGLAKSG